MTGAAQNIPIRGNKMAGRNQIHDVPRCRVRHSANQSVTSATPLVLAFDTDDHVQDGMHSTTVSNSRITIRSAGFYLLALNVFFDISAAGTYRIAQIRLNGTTTIADVRTPPVAGGADGTSLCVSTPYPLNAGDYVEAIANQNSGGPLNVLTSFNFTPIFSATFASTL